MPKFHADVKRLLPALFAQEPFKSRTVGFQRPRAGSSVGRERHQSPERRSVPTDAAVGRVQHLRLGALRADARQSRAARRGVGGAVRIHRDPRQRQDLWWRRNLQRSGDGVGRQRVLAVRLRPRVRPSLRGARRRVLHVRCRLRDRRGREAGAVGAERHRAARSGAAEVEGSRDAGTPLPTPWNKEEYEKHTAGIQQRRREIRARNAPEAGDGCALPRAAGLGHEVPVVDDLLGPRRGVRGRAGTKRADSTGPRPTASCSRGIRSGSAACAAARSTRIIDLYSR